MAGVQLILTVDVVGEPAVMPEGVVGGVRSVWSVTLCGISSSRSELLS